MIYFGGHQLLGNNRLQFVTVSDSRHDALYRHVMPRHLAFDIEFIAKISAAGGYLDAVWRP